MNKIVNLLKEDKGQGMVEYGLIIALVAIAVIASITLLGGNLRNVFNHINNKLKDTNPAGNVVPIT